MSVPSFLQFVELPTKVASVIPFLLGTLFALYRYRSFNLGSFLAMLVSLLAFDMATTAINNYLDYRQAQPNADGSRLTESAMAKCGISETAARATIALLLVVAVSAGIWLTLRTNLLVLVVGMLSFAAGVLYTFGPIPLSRMPLGEIFSGGFMGFVIPFLAAYIHTGDQQLASLTGQSGLLLLSVNLPEVLALLLFAAPAMAGIANIMLANNICDVDEDILNRRFTLPYYLGSEQAHRLFAALYYLGYASVLLAVLLRLIPGSSLLVLLTLPAVWRNVRAFRQHPSKQATFILSVRNFVMVNLAQTLALAVALLLRVAR